MCRPGFIRITFKKCLQDNKHDVIYTQQCIKNNRHDTMLDEFAWHSKTLTNDYSLI